MPGEPRIPLSAAQERVWLECQLDAASPTAHRPVALRLEGPLDEAALERALNEILVRHEILRAVVWEEDGQPWQEIRPHAAIGLERKDLCGQPADAREAEARRIASEEAWKPFDLTRGPLVRAVLLRLDERLHVLLLLTHHIVFDGWSEAVLLGELRRLYAAFSRGEPSPLPPLPCGYAGHVWKERERMSRPEFARKLEAWRERLAGSAPSLALPSFGGDPSAPRYLGEARTMVLPQELTAAVKVLSRSERATPFMTLLAAFQLLLARYSGQDDLVVGVPVAGRGRSELEGLIGCFINVLLFRAQLEGEPAAREFIARTRGFTLAALSDQDAPLPLVVQALDAGARRTAPFQAMFQLRNLPAAGAAPLGDLRIEAFPFESGIAGVEVSLEVKETAGSLLCRLAYARRVLDGGQAERMLGHYRNLLESFVRRPEECVWRLGMLSEAERRQVLVEWNDTHDDFPAVCAHELFEQQERKTPEAVAVIAENAVLTYRELNRRANQVARRLQALGVGPETIVAVFLERSPEMLFAHLGTYKAGGAYLQLDPKHPAARNRAVLADARPAVLITTLRFAADWAGLAPYVLCLDEPWEDRGADPDENPASGVTPDNLAYVIYTSGSTGAPKGVMVCHRSLCNYLFYKQRDFPLSEGDRHLQRSALTFDDLVWEYLQPLMAGGAVVQARSGGESDGAYLVDLIARHGVTVGSMVASQLEMWLAEPGVRRCVTLRRMTSGGEVLPPALVNRFHECLDAQLINGYGPAETTISSTYYVCPAVVKERTVSIGRPIANTEIYILDRWRQPVPVGVTGELYIGGAGLARGYLNRPDLTSEKFLPHPFDPRPGARVYRTGDLAAYRPDGNVEFVGRADYQIKLRGQRIELGEIESLLHEHPDVQYAAVTVWEPTAGDRALAAYVVPRAGAVCDPVELRRFLSERLPAYMVPSDWVLLDSMPFTSSGKVDRKSLPRPARRRAAGPGLAEAPANKLEGRLRGIWEEVLGAAPVGLDDDFFDLGGHSLLAVRLFSRVEKEFGVRLPVGTLLEAGTVRTLARAIEQRGVDGRWRSLVAIQRGRSELPLFCLHGNDGDVLFYREMAAAMGEAQTVYGLQSPLLGRGHFSGRSLEDLAGLYLEEICAVQTRGPYCLVGFCMGAYLALEVAVRLQKRGEEIGVLAVVETPGNWKLVRSLTDDLKYHWRRWAARGAGGWRYLAGRVKFRLARIEDAVAEAAGGFAPAFGTAAAEWALRRRARAAHIRASRAYKPSVFHGAMIYVEGEQGATGDYQHFWAPAVEGEIRRYLVPGEGIGVLSGPGARALAEVLRTALAGVRRGGPAASGPRETL